MTYGYLKPQRSSTDYVPRIFGFKVQQCLPLLTLTYTEEWTLRTFLTDTRLEWHAGFGILPASPSCRLIFSFFGWVLDSVQLKSGTKGKVSCQDKKNSCVLQAGFVQPVGVIELSLSRFTVAKMTRCQMCTDIYSYSKLLSCCAPIETRAIDQT